MIRPNLFPGFLGAAAFSVLFLVAAAPAPPPSPPPPAPSSPFDAAFDGGKTMRLDLTHAGGKGAEVIALDRVVDDGAWAGRRSALEEDLGLGGWRFRVVDSASGRLLFSEGYSSVWAEWETTPEAKKAERSFSESLRLPWPRRPVEVILERRDAANVFRRARVFAVDPSSPEVNPAPPAVRGNVRKILQNGPSAAKVDLLVLGDGYAEADLPKFRGDVDRMVSILFTYEPFRSRRDDFNVRALEVASPVSGVHRPLSQLFRRSPFGIQYGVFGSERYALSTDDRAIRDAASGAPYDAIAVLLNDARYGGGGIYNHQATASVDTAFAEYVFVHEFGHAFAGLGDEYYTSEVAYETGATDPPEPWEPNVTALKGGRPKWASLVTPGTPLPTPWEKEPFEKQSRAFQAERKAKIAAGASPAEIDEVFVRQKAAETKLLGSMKYAGTVGAFEGASYEPKGLYRPSADCIMFTRDPVGFCPVCRQAISRTIDRAVGLRAGR